MQSLLKLLSDEKLSCIVEQHGILYKRIGKGISPILRLYEEGTLEDASMSDRIIGKAAAMLMVYGGIKEVETLLISEAAFQFFTKHHIPISYEEKIPYVINNRGDGMCPLEEALLHIEDMDIGYSVIIETLERLKGNTFKQ